MLSRPNSRRWPGFSVRLNSRSDSGVRSHWKSIGSVSPSKFSRSAGAASGGWPATSNSNCGRALPSLVRSQPSAPETIG